MPACLSLSLDDERPLSKSTSTRVPGTSTAEWGIYRYSLGELGVCVQVVLQYQVPGTIFLALLRLFSYPDMQVEHFVQSYVYKTAYTQELWQAMQLRRHRSWAFYSFTSMNTFLCRRFYSSTHVLFTVWHIRVRMVFMPSGTTTRYENSPTGGYIVFSYYSEKRHPPWLGGGVSQMYPRWLGFGNSQKYARRSKNSRGQELSGILYFLYFCLSFILFRRRTPK